MRIAKKSDWKNKELSKNKIVVDLDITFNEEEMTVIKKGIIPSAMEDKWFIYYEDNKLFFHRSWTGYCIYIVHFENNKMVKAEINRDSKQCNETNDEKDKKLISYLIDVLLLNKNADFPSDELSIEKKTLENWSQVGRAMVENKNKNDEIEK
jgi:8-oxo-dGTP diphosphatase